MRSGVGLVQFDVRRLDGELAALGHGVAGVDRQVHEDLLDLAGVGLDAAQVRLEGGRPGATSSPMSRRSIFSASAHDLVEVQHLGCEHLLAAEGQELPGQPAARSPALRISWRAIRT